MAMKMSFVKLLLPFLLIVMGLLLYAGGVSAKPQEYRVLISDSDGNISQVLTKSEIVHKYKVTNAVAAQLSEDRIKQLSKNPKIKIEPDSQIKIADTELDNSWGVNQIGAGIAQTEGITGAGVKVGILDTGIDYTHPELAAVYKGGYDFVNNDSDPMDDNGHGTHVAGIIAAADNGVGVVGVAPNVELYAIKVMDANGSGTWSVILQGLDWAVANGIQITNNSYGGQDYSSIVEAAFQNAWNNGILSVAAAGNSGGSSTADTTLYPARYNSVIAVAATDTNKVRTSFSSTGPATEISAPGLNIDSTWPGGGYKVLSGTSMASPHVVGVAALIKSAHPDWDNKTIRGQLDAGADDLGTPGYDSLYGFGLVDAVKDVGSLIPNPPQPPQLSPRLLQAVETCDATNISSTQATLNGQLTTLGSFASVKVWFAIAKVGENVSYDTPMQTMTNTGLFSYNKTGLLPGTQYWFFAIAYNGVNAVIGNELVFTTLAAPSPSPTPIVPSPTPSSSPSPAPSPSPTPSPSPSPSPSPAPSPSPTPSSSPSPSPSPAPTPSPAPADSVVTLDTNMQFLEDSLVFETVASISGSGVASGSGLADAIVTVRVVGPAGTSYNLSGASDSTGKVKIILNQNPQWGSWRVTVTDVTCQYTWDSQDSLTSANLTVKKQRK
jgi:subtilisin